MNIQKNQFTGAWHHARKPLFLMLLLAAFAGSAQAESLIPNPTFSKDVNEDGWPDGWARLAGASWEQSDAGFRYVRLNQETPGALRMFYLDVPLPDGTEQVSLSGKVRAEGIVPGKEIWFDARVFSQFLDASGSKIQEGKPRPYIIAKKGSSDWKEFSFTYDVPGGAASLMLMVGHFNTQSGVVDIAELKLEAVAGGE